MALGEREPVGRYRDQRVLGWAGEDAEQLGFLLLVSTCRWCPSLSACKLCV